MRRVFIVDAPRNTVNFHCAESIGRTGAWGKFVVFVKMKGRSSERRREA